MLDVVSQSCIQFCKTTVFMRTYSQGHSICLWAVRGQISFSAVPQRWSSWNYLL